MGVFAVVHDVLVILKDHSGDPGADVNGDFDLSKKWVVVEYRDEQPQSVRIILNAAHGRFLTEDPIIRKRDRIYVRITEVDGTIHEDVFHVRRIKRKRQIGAGKMLELFCPHQSENHWNKTASFRKRGKRISGNEALALVISGINANRGTAEPLIEIPTFDTVKKVGNDLDPNTRNNYFFDSAKVATAIKEIKDTEVQPIEGGGSFKPVYVRFKSKYVHPGVDLDVVQLQAFEQGTKDDGAGNTTNIPSLTLVHPLEGVGRPNYLTLDSDEDPEEGTNLIAIGDKFSGSYPVELMKYFGAKSVFNSAREWDSTAAYKVGHLVQHLLITYECILANTNNVPPNATFWIVRTFVKPALWLTATAYVLNDLVRHNDIAYKAILAHTSNSGNEPPDDTNWVRVHFPPTVDYSPLTKDNAGNQYWLNALAGAKHASTNNGQTVMVDPNVIIPDKFHPRTHVDWIGLDSALIPADLLVGGNVPDAFRVLVIDEATGAGIGLNDFAGNDPAGLLKAGNIVEFFDDDNDGTGTWRVFKSKVAGDDQEVFNWYEGEPWVKNPCETTFVLTLPLDYVDTVGICRNIITNSPKARATVWIKGSYQMFEVPIRGRIGGFVPNRPFECQHSVRFDTGAGRVDMGNSSMLTELDGSTSGVFISSEGGAQFLASFIQNPAYIGFNIHSRWPRTGQGTPFASVSAGEKIKNPTTDLNNMDLTHTLLSEWFGPQVEDYYPFQAFAAWIKLSISDSILGFLDPLDGDFIVGIWMADRQDAVKILEFPVGRNNENLPASGEFGKLKPYIGVPGPAVWLNAQEPEGTVAFDPSEFLVGGIYTRDSFDTQGRYKGALRSRFLNKSPMRMHLDMYRMIKPLVCTNVDEPAAKPTVNIEPLKINKSSITGYEQLKNYVLGLAGYLGIDRRALNMEVRPGRAVAFGDPVYVTDAEVFDDNNDAISNTFKGVVDGITITCSKTKDGPAGIKKLLRIIKRFWPV
ncbi:hypothetical protein LCGC14_0380230 [marine sediment metagenome]|uniref:Chitin-binding type-3 domain-containing protein n=1 Tax=marine sediment metagenome TaxID=412755 RepID=A0A0F9TKK1_9ZZZZ